MRSVRDVLLGEIKRQPDLQGLVGACGTTPSRAPPKDSSIAKLRKKVAKTLGLSVKAAEKHHSASPWRWKLVESVIAKTGDPDTILSEWLRDGAPFGIAKEIAPGGLLPLISEHTTLSQEDLLEKAAFDVNHGSFREVVDGNQPAMVELQSLVDEGFARICRDSSDAADLLGQQPVITPLGNVSKIKEDGSRKDRLIQDFKASCVNNASRVAERQVLPRFSDHAQDLATLSASGSSVGVFILDFKHAFMTIPLAPEEMPFNASIIPEGITRQRPALDATEPESGTILIWQVLGFGGHANPLVYSRVACLAARTGQALLFDQPADSGIGHGRLQLYVDDPAVTLAGTTEQQMLAIDLLVCWFLVLGIPLSWRKGMYAGQGAIHDWIGVSFEVEEKGVATLTLPKEFCRSLLVLAKIFANADQRVATLKQAQELCGKAGRVAQVVPHTRPFLLGLYGALAGSLAAQRARSREAPPGKVATRRYRHCAAWLVRLLEDRQEDRLPVELRSEVERRG